MSKLLDDTLHAFVESIRLFECRKRVHIKPTLSLAEENFVVKLTLLNLCYLIFFEPLDSLAIFPEAVLEWLAGDNIGAKTMLFAPAPVARVCSAV